MLGRSCESVSFEEKIVLPLIAVSKCDLQVHIQAGLLAF